MKGGYLKWIPEGGQGGKDLRVRPWMVVVALGLAVVGGGVALMGWAGLAGYGVLRTRLVTLEKENNRLRSALQDLSERVRQLDLALDSLYQKDLAVRTLLGEQYPRLTSEVLGIGGALSLPRGISPEDRDLYLLSRRVERLERFVELERRSFDSLQEVVASRMETLQYTPSIWPVRGYLASTFGMRRDPFTGRRKMHKGVDISAPVGTPVMVTADGVVDRIWFDRNGFGLVVEVTHRNGIKTIYAHNSKILVKVGQKVRRGDVIALVGNSGRSTGPHVHYEVHVRGKAVDPLQFMIPDHLFYD